MRGSELFVESGEAPALIAFLDERLRAFNEAITGISDAKPLHARIRNASGAIIAAVSGHSWGGCCEIMQLWVREDERGRGHGRALMRAVEGEAGRRRCSQITVATHSFQAPHFYEKLGYQPVGAVVDYPKGHAKLHYVKRLNTSL
jgi:ribosomal protein S18 acetylase RimI-like enzyme